MIVDQSASTDVERERILDALRHFEEKTCIRFHPRQNGSGGVFFQRGPG